jgi:hypothetical protein
VTDLDEMRRRTEILRQIAEQLIGHSRTRFPRRPPWWKFRARRIYRQAAREFAEYGRRASKGT